MFLFESLILLALSLFALIANGVCLWGLALKTALPESVKYFLVNVTAALLLISLCTFLKALRKINLSLYGFRKLSFLMCTLVEFPKAVAEYVMLLTVCMIAVERWFASRPEKNTKTVSKKTAALLTFSAWLVATVAVALVSFHESYYHFYADRYHHDHVHYDTFHGGYCLCFCEVYLLVDHEFVFACMAVLSLLSIGSACLYIYIYRYSVADMEQFSLNTNYNLNYRYQIRQNIKITRMLLPNIALSYLSSLVFYVATTVTEWRLNENEYSHLDIGQINLIQVSGLAFSLGSRFEVGLLCHSLTNVIDI